MSPQDFPDYFKSVIFLTAWNPFVVVVGPNLFKGIFKAVQMTIFRRLISLDKSHGFEGSPILASLNFEAQIIRFRSRFPGQNGVVPDNR